MLTDLSLAIPSRRRACVIDWRILQNEIGWTNSLTNTRKSAARSRYGLFTSARPTIIINSRPLFLARMDLARRPRQGLTPERQATASCSGLALHSGFVNRLPCVKEPTFSGATLD